MERFVRAFLFGQHTMKTARELRQRLEPGEVANLIQRCRFKDRDACELLLAYVRQLCLDVAVRNYRMSLDDAEDLAQVAVLRVVQRLDQLRDAQAFPAWCRQLAHRAALDLRRERRPQLSTEVALEDADLVADAEAVVSYTRVILRADLEKALGRLPELYRQPIELHFLDEIPQDEVGEILGRPRGTVASQIDRGLRRLKQAVSPTLAL